MPTVGTSRLGRTLVLVLALVAGAGLVAELVHHATGGGYPAYLVGLFSLSYEGNLPTWYSSALLLGCAVLLWDIGHGERVAAQRRYWRGLAVVFTLMSIDETVELHEQLAGTLDVGGALRFDWVVFGVAFAAIVALITVPFLRRLPAVTRKMFVVAGAIYVGGAAGMELPLGWWTAQAGADNLVYGLLDWTEESMEMLGASLFLWALWRCRQDQPSPG